MPNLKLRSDAGLDQDRLWALWIAQGVITKSTKHREDGPVWSSCPQVTEISVTVAGTPLQEKELRVKFHRHSVLAGCCSLYLLDFTIRLLFREDVVKYKMQNCNFW